MCYIQRFLNLTKRYTNKTLVHLWFTAVTHQSGSIVIQDLEREMLGKLDFKLPFYFIYVHDTLTAEIATDSIVDKFNAHHSRLQFTREIGEDRTNFLDTNIIKNNNKLIFDWYHKPIRADI